MDVSPDFTAAIGLGAAGLALSVGLEGLLTPRPGLRRPIAAWLAHAGIFLALYGLLTTGTARPWCSLAGALAPLLTLILVSNAKMRSMREPFVAQDYEYFIDVIGHPRLFLPFLGVKGFLLAAVLFVAALLGFLCEPTPENRFQINGQGGALAMILTCAGLSLVYAFLRPLRVSFAPEADLRRLGLLPCIWAYALSMRRLPDAGASRWAAIPSASIKTPRPHLVAVQGESFFDARRLYPGIRKDVLRHFDSLCRESVRYGKLRVPAWGANTVRTEFAFLSGMSQSALGAHRFNPYRMLAAGHPIPSLPLFLKKLGYHAVCVHPYSANFYNRRKVFRQWGFDIFLDIRHFAAARRFGPFTADTEVAKAIFALLRDATAPLFIFAVTMENHGPLHLERARPKDVARLYANPPPDGCEELTVYLRHLRHTDMLLGMLHSRLQNSALPASICCYGDHVPIMPGVYAAAASAASTDYVLWNNEQCGAEAASYPLSGDEEKQPTASAARHLATDWLRYAGILTS